MSAAEKPGWLTPQEQAASDELNSVGSRGTNVRRCFRDDPGATDPAPAPRLTVVPYADSDLAEWTELYGLFRNANADERRVLMRIARQFSLKGRREYGALNIAADKRNHPKEALAEVADALFYVAVALEREP